MKHQGIETLYRNIRFRSRLEAKWAAFFDNLSWPWEYEPIDLQGYIPDFILKFPRIEVDENEEDWGMYNGPLLVEVKSVFDFEELRKYTDKIEKSGWGREALIVGATLFRSRYYSILGLMLDRSCFYGEWDEAVLINCPGCDQPSIFHSAGSHHCRICGYHKPYGSLNWEPLWADATNKVQYISRR